MRGQAARVTAQRRVAEDVERLPHEDREEEVEGGVRVRHAREDDRPPARLAELVELHLVAVQDPRDLLDGQGLQAHVAADDDRLERLAGRRLERLVVRQGEVGLRRRGLPGPHPREPAAPVRERPALEVRLDGLAGPDEPHPRLELREKDVERAHVRLVLLLRLGQPEQDQQPGEVPVILGAVAKQVGDERRVEESLGVLPEGVACVVLVARRVLDEALDEGEDVRLAPDVAKRVVVV